ncbi:complement C1q tumor necrosis factor-related protein 3-like [Mytilus trossulus]|uniref:complement C1q tumor necrosis factor-related protein 3-like n=1 Tax=Mytilus trossulus TaxID=6551 RepID=UPI0030073EE8
MRNDFFTGTNPAFFATEKEHINLGSNTIVKFDTVKTNIDNGYDVITGVFTAPRAGTYEFSENFISGNTNFLELNLMKNNEFIVRGHAAQAMSTAGSLRAIVELNDGDRIYIKHPRSSGVLHGDHYSMFSGHLI